MNTLGKGDCPAKLELASHVDFEVGTGSYAWIDVKAFRASCSIDRDEQILASLIASPSYCDDYTGHGPQPLAPPRHGPYWLDRIGVQDFSLVGVDDFVDRLSQWMDGLGDVVADDDKREVLAKLKQFLSGGEVIYELANLRPRAEHDYGEMVGRDGFNEFVLIDPSRTSLRLLVTWDD